MLRSSVVSAQAIVGRKRTFDLPESDTDCAYPIYHSRSPRGETRNRLASLAPPPKRSPNPEIAFIPRPCLPVFNKEPGLRSTRTSPMTPPRASPVSTGGAEAELPSFIQFRDLRAPQEQDAQSPSMTLFATVVEGRTQILSDTNRLSLCKCCHSTLHSF